MLLRILKNIFIICSLINLPIYAAQKDSDSFTFGKLKIKGWLLGKDRFSQFYSIEYGDQFTNEKHAHALQNFLSELQNNGYFNVIVEDKVEYNKEIKQANVTLNLSNLDCFNIVSSTVNIIAPDKFDKSEIKQFQDKILGFVSRRINNNYYLSSLVDEQLVDIKKYLLRKGFLKVDVEVKNSIDKDKKSIILNFNATIGECKKYIFKNNSFFSQEQLADQLFIIDDADLHIPASLLVDDIKELYHKNGFLFVDVAWSENEKEYIFDIQEGQRIKVTKINVDGNKAQINLEKLISNNFSQFFKQEFYDEELLQIAIDSLVDELRSMGYMDADATKGDLNKLSENCYELKLNLKLGKQRKLKKVTIEGYQDVLKNSPYEKYFNIIKAEVFDINLIDDMRKWLLKYFHDQGYLYVTVKPEIIENKDGVELIWHIDKKTERVKFGKTTVSGKTSVSNDIILRELQYKEGELLDKEKLDQTVKKIKALNIFESVSLKTENLGQAQDAKNILIKCIPDDQFEIRTRLGFQQVSKSFTNISATTYIVGGSFLWKNPGKMADLFRIDADLTRYSRNFTIGYELPWLFNQPIRTQSRVYSLRFEQPMIAHSHDRLYKESHDGIAVTFIPNYFNWAQMAVNVGFEWNKLSDISLAAAHAIEYEPQLLNMRIPTFYLEPSISINRFDNTTNPTKGYFTRFCAKGVFPTNVKSGSFIKLLFEQSFVYPLYNCVIGALRFRFGHIFNDRFNTILPTERFYLGGACSLRGYETDMVPPLNTFLTASGQNAWAPVGGKTMVNLNAEIRFPIYKDLGGVIFNDMGILTQDCFTDILGDKWLGATGLGLRYTTPLGPIRFDVGYKWKKRTPDDKRFAWFLTLGHAF